MIINAEDFRLNFYSILKMANENNEAIKVQTINGDIAIIGTDMINEINNNINIKGL